MGRLSGWGAWIATVMGTAKSKVAVMTIEQSTTVCQENWGCISLGRMSVSDREYVPECASRLFIIIECPRYRYRL